MKVAILSVILIVGTVSAQNNERGECPRSSPGFGVCVFNPEINCTGDEKCQNGQICCPDGCNRSCKDPIKPSETNKCPPSAPTFGACVFNPEVNCVSDDTCTNGQVCCPNGCNKVCKDVFNGPKNRPYRSEDEILPKSKSSNNKKCPAVQPSFGACVFDTKVNCIEDKECTNGQLCCPSGCNKVCQDPEYTAVDPPRPPQGPPKRCPAAPETFGSCLFDPKVNCGSDAECTNGQLCCSNGCNKVCKDPIVAAVDPPRPPPPQQKSSKCPKAPVTFGTCVFDPKSNCLADNECNNGQVCCSDGCNKVCKDPVADDEPSQDSNTDNQCPASSPSFGACVFDSKVNCLENSECDNGKICCPSGCNKVCANPVPTLVHPSTKP